MKWMKNYFFNRDDRNCRNCQKTQQGKNFVCFILEQNNYDREQNQLPYFWAINSVSIAVFSNIHVKSRAINSVLKKCLLLEINQSRVFSNILEAFFQGRLTWAIPLRNRNMHAATIPLDNPPNAIMLRLDKVRQAEIILLGTVWSHCDENRIWIPA